MISYSQAMEILKLNVIDIGTIELPIIEALGHFCANDINAPISIPPFDNSAMDGFGVKVEWLEFASPTNPMLIPKAHAIGAGEIRDDDGFFTPHIMTGAKTPNWVEAVIPIENTKEANGNIEFTSKVKPNENIRKIGTDIEKGLAVLRAGQKINPEHIAVLAALGIAKIEVKAIAPINIFSTGNEIIAHDAGPLKPGQIYNSNAPYLLARAKEAGLNANYGGPIKDDKDEFISKIKALPPKSIIITTGAVSMGKYDFIPMALNEIGAIIHFHKCNIRPGKPILFASLPNGSIFFGLPGNPISSAIGFNFFVLKFIDFMLGKNTQTQIAVLENDFSKSSSFRQFVKAIVTHDGKLKILDGQESYKILPMVMANAWAILPEDINEFKKGSSLEFLPYGAAI